MPLDFYYIPPSPPCRSVLMAAKELDIELNLKTVDLLQGEHLKPEFLKINPNHTVPVLVDGDLTIRDSRAILCYLVNQYRPGHALYPTDPKARAQVDSMLYFDCSVWAPVQRDLHRPLLFGAATEVSEEALKAYNEKLKVLDTMLEGHDYLAGDSKTLADLSLYSMIGMGALVDFDFSPYKNVDAWIKRVKASVADDEEINAKPIHVLKAIMADRIATKKAKAQ